jgi:hypothetical protein
MKLVGCQPLRSIQYFAVFSSFTLLTGNVRMTFGHLSAR